jgi:hypothetical protein
MEDNTQIGKLPSKKVVKDSFLENQGNDERSPYCVRFPLEGEWRAVHSPHDKIPSHGTNQFGQRFAYDFLNEEDYTFASKFSTQLIWTCFGFPLAKTSGWKKRILSPVEGKVVAVQDGWPERKRLNFFDVIRAMTIGFFLDEEKLREDFRPIGGNNLIIEADSFFVFIAHISTNSTKVAIGDQVKIGQHIGDVGHTGNSTAPHLHIHLMDCADLTIAKGLPMSFRGYETLEGEEWQKVENGIPANGVPLRA